jgi:hypothetical protein
VSDIIAKALDAGWWPGWFVIGFLLWMNARNNALWHELWKADLEAKVKIAEALRQLRETLRARRGEDDTE